MKTLFNIKIIFLFTLILLFFTFSIVEGKKKWAIDLSATGNEDPNCNEDLPFDTLYCNNSKCGCLHGTSTTLGCVAPYTFSYDATGDILSEGPFYLQTLVTSDCVSFYVTGELVTIENEGSQTIRDTDTCFEEAGAGKRFCIILCLRQGEDNFYNPELRYPIISCEIEFTHCFNINENAGDNYPNLELPCPKEDDDSSAVRISNNLF